MSLTIIKGNIFNTKAQTIVNTVNCVGVMGKGIALVFKLRYPSMFEKYQDLCKQKLIAPGKLWLYKEEVARPWVLNFPTKTHWKLPSEYEYVELGLQKFVSTYKEKGIESAAFPLLGASNGGLDRDRVIEIMKKYLSQCDISIEIYEYDPMAKDDLFDTFKGRWNSLSLVEKKNAGVKNRKQIELIDEAVNSGEIGSVFSLISYKGIGLATLQKCFNLVVNSHQTPKLDL